MAILRTLRIHKYLDVAPTTLTFHPRRNLLLGVNGGGKTTLLNLIAMVLNLDFRELEKQAFEIGFVLEEPGWSMDVEIRNEASALPRELSIHDRRGVPLEGAFVPAVRIELRSRRDERTAHFTTNGRTATVQHIDGEVVDLDWSFPALSTLTFFGAMGMAVGDIPELGEVNRFDEGIDFFRRIHSDSESLIRVSRLGKARILSNLTPNAFHAQLRRHTLNLGERLSFDSAEHEFLKKFVEATGFDRVRLSADLIDRPQADASGTHTERFRLTLYCARGEREFIQNELSFGQKRLWAFLYYLACNSHSVVADELVNGLHHRWIKLCVERIGDRQAFLTSQNPLLFDFIPLGTLEEPRCTFLRCDLETPKMRWRNLDEDETRRLYEAYDAGIESAGEILQTRGLW